MSDQFTVPESYIDSITSHLGSLPARIRTALMSVHRHRFLDEWFRLEINNLQAAFCQVKVDRDAPSKEALTEIYSNQALVTVHDGIFPTSSTSQPSLVARMLELLEIESGMHVLEIGTGTGYNAALLAELCENPSHVFSIEYQKAVADKARRFLQEEGCAGVHVVHGDGYQGIEDGAPFDRIIATVECPDISPHWLEQLSPEGSMLIPLQHGSNDPLVRLIRDQRDPQIAVGKIVDRSSFMEIQGFLDWGNPWRTFGLKMLPEEPEWSRPFPDHLAISEPCHHPASVHNHWCFHFYLTLCSRELWDDNRGYGLADPASHTVVIFTSEGVEAYSATRDADACERLYERLLSLHRKWANLGYPAPTDYTLTFSPKTRFDASSTDPTLEWYIERPCFLETIRLT